MVSRAGYIVITDYTWIILDRCVHDAGVGTVMVAKFCQGPSISGYIEIPCTGIRVKTATVGEATWDYMILFTTAAQGAEAAALSVWG